MLGLNQALSVGAHRCVRPNDSPFPSGFGADTSVLPYRAMRESALQRHMVPLRRKHTEDQRYTFSVLHQTSVRPKNRFVGAHRCVRPNDSPFPGGFGADTSVRPYSCTPGSAPTLAHLGLPRQLHTWVCPDKGAHGSDSTEAHVGPAIREAVFAVGLSGHRRSLIWKKATPPGHDSGKKSFRTRCEPGPVVKIPHLP